LKGGGLVMETQEYVEYLLKNYHELRKDVEQLKFELNYLQELEPEEVIDALNYTSPQGEKVDPGRVSDKTCNIALVYREVTERINRTSKRELEKMITATEYELMKLEYCIDRLEGKISEVIKDIYLQRMSWAEVCKKHYISEKTLNKYRRQAVSKLVEMFELTKLVV